MSLTTPPSQFDLRNKIKLWGENFGFQHIGISNTSLLHTESQLTEWLEKKFHGSMHYMEKHGMKRCRPHELEPGTISIISARMDYYPAESKNAMDVLNNKDLAYISRYALGRDYHKTLRKRLQQLAKKIEQEIGPTGFRVFVDSAPVMEKAIAEKAGLGWIGKHSNLLSRESGSWFFLGEIYVDIELPIDQASSAHCGNCTKCIDDCPTDAIVAPYIVDARRCISYLTIENREAIPVEFRQAMGNRIYGCDDCQLVCPWNRFSTPTHETDFSVRHRLDDVTLVKLFSWDEETFLKNTEGSPIRRIGYESWQRNIAVALGNADFSNEIVVVLQNKLPDSTPLVQEHIEWALNQHISKKISS